MARSFTRESKNLSAKVQPMVDEVFQNLVDQFSDPYTCLRELVQNAMDAGTEQIDIKTRYFDDPGGFCLEVRDYGGGMNRAIIDGKLTRLFSSDKENDLTKIGKFGIGFVSVFSLKPELVIVDTGRDGEFWRIAFDGGTDFQLFVLKEPIEGTSVRVHKILPYDQYDYFVARCLTTVSLWCRHSATTICFNGERINQPLVVDSVVRIDHRSALGDFNIGVHTERLAPYGFYNTGLTLTESHQDRWPGVTFKVLSSHLEHTLTRDAVIQDDNYRKVEAKLVKLIVNDLYPAVAKRLRDPATQEETARQARVFLSQHTTKLSAAQKKLPLVDDVFGESVSFTDLASCAKQEARLFTCDKVTKLARRAAREGLPILKVGLDSSLASLLTLLFGVPVVGLRENLAVSLPVPRPPGFAALESAMKSLLREGRLTVTSIVLVEYPESPVDREKGPGVFALGADRLVRRYRKGFWATKYLLPHQLLLDVDHPLVRKSVTRLEDPQTCRTAAYILCKSALLNDGLDPAVETRLLNTILDRG